jgi:hypothetical protein
MGRLRVAGERQADLEMIWKSDPNKVVPTSRVVLGLLLAASLLITGGLDMSSERAVILTQRLVPDAVHNVALELKGKTFYATAAESHTYYFYQHLFLSDLIISILITVSVLIFDRYRKNRRMRPILKDER